jgi:hypothetical protein
MAAGSAPHHAVQIDPASKQRRNRNFQEKLRIVEGGLFAPKEEMVAMRDATGSVEDGNWDSILATEMESFVLDGLVGDAVKFLF